jgi:hypothetical protein
MENPLANSLKTDGSDQASLPCEKFSIGSTQDLSLVVELFSCFVTNTFLFNSWFGQT